MMTKFTIITASYNYEDYIKETIESILAQTYTNWEMLIIDDGSKDNSVNIIKSYCQKDDRIKLLTHEKNQNKGLVETVKLGLNKAKTEWVVFLESDDTIRADYLEKKAQIIQNNPDVKFIFNAVNLFGNEDRIKEYDRYFSEQANLLKKNQYPKSQIKCFKKINIVPTFSCVAMKKELFENVSFKTPIKAYLDYYLWMQIAHKTSFYYIDEKLTNWRLHNSYIKTRKKDPISDFLFTYSKKKLTARPCLKFLMSALYPYYYLTGLRKSLVKVHIKINPKKGSGVYIFFLNKEYRLGDKNAV